MAGSRKKVSGKAVNKPVPAMSSKSATAPSVSDASPAKRKVMTSSEIEAAAQKGPVEDVLAVKAEHSQPSAPTTVKTLQEGDSAKGKVSALADEEVETVPSEAPVAKADVKDVNPAENSLNDGLAAKSEPGSTVPLSTSAPKQTKPVRKSPIAKSGAARRVAMTKPAAPKSTAPTSSTKSEKASTVSTKSKPAATSKSAASSAPKKTTTKAAPKKAAAAPASEATKTSPAPAPKPAPVNTTAKATEPKSPVQAAKPAAAPSPAKSETAPKPVEAKPKAATKQPDVFGFGALFMDGTGMEPYFEIWKTPEVEAMVSASNDAFEGSVSAANEAFGKIFETMTGQADVFSGAGSRVAAQYEELLDTQKKSFEEVWQATMAMFEKTGGIGTELSSWMQKEFEASQDDLDELTKVESLTDLQDLHTRIVNRCYANSMAEGEKMQKLMFAAVSDGLDAINKAANVTMK